MVGMVELCVMILGTWWRRKLEYTEKRVVWISGVDSWAHSSMMGQSERWEVGHCELGQVGQSKLGEAGLKELG